MAGPYRVMHDAKKLSRGVDQSRVVFFKKTGGETKEVGWLEGGGANWWLKFQTATPNDIILFHLILFLKQQGSVRGNYRTNL